VWSTAILGALCGTGAWRVILVLGCVVAVVLLIGGLLERWWLAAFAGAEKRPDDAR